MNIEIYFQHLVTRRLWKYVNLPQLKPQYQWQTQQRKSMPVATVTWYTCSMISRDLQLLKKATSFQNIIITKNEQWRKDYIQVNHYKWRLKCKNMRRYYIHYFAAVFYIFRQKTLVVLYYHVRLSVNTDMWSTTKIFFFQGWY
jgi:hypothetical protein